MRIAFHTFGCKLNQYETEALADPFASSGHSVVGAHEEADVYIINTCTVTARADHKARALVRRVSRRRPDSTVVVTGCSAQLEAEAFAGLGSNVIVVSQAAKPRLLDITRILAACGPAGFAEAVLAAADPAGPQESRDPFRYEARRLSFHSRAFLKIQDGCDTRCPYCRVPIARGASVSLDAGEVLRRAAELAGIGFREIVLTGVNICAYRSGTVGLAGLLKELVGTVGQARLRLSSLEPDAVNEDLIDAVSHPKVCPHFHLALQSGSDSVLARMRRRYSAGQALDAVSALRGAKGDPFMAADVIAGFPGETESEHGETLELVRSADFSALHVFPFSPRRGTEAAGFEGQVPERMRTQRAMELTAVSHGSGDAYRSRWMGREVEVLIEDHHRAWAGLLGTTENYLKVLVQGAGGKPGEHRGKIIRARIISSGTEGDDACRADFMAFLA